MMRTVAFMIIGSTFALSSTVKAETITSSVDAQSSSMSSGLRGYQALNDTSIDLVLYAAGAYGGFPFDLGNGGTSAATGAPSQNAGGSGSSSNIGGSGAEAGALPVVVSDDAGSGVGASASSTDSFGDSSTPSIGNLGGDVGGSGQMSVPLPGSALLLGAGLLAFGVAGFGLRRREAIMAG